MDECPIRHSLEALKTELCTKSIEEEKLCYNLNDEKHDREIQFEGRKIVSALYVHPLVSFWIRLVECRPLS